MDSKIHVICRVDYQIYKFDPFSRFHQLILYSAPRPIFTDLQTWQSSVRPKRTNLLSIQGKTSSDHCGLVGWFLDKTVPLWMKCTSSCVSFIHFINFENLVFSPIMNLKFVNESNTIFWPSWIIHREEKIPKISA